MSSLTLSSLLISRMCLQQEVQEAPNCCLTSLQQPVPRQNGRKVRSPDARDKQAFLAESHVTSRRATDQAKNLFWLAYLTTHLVRHQVVLDVVMFPVTSPYLALAQASIPNAPAWASISEAPTGILVSRLKAAAESRFKVPQNVPGLNRESE